jgi:menaquinone-specific isochorismate synthase
MSLAVRWEQVEEERSLLDLLSALLDDERFAFVSGGEGVVGWGVAARIAVGTGPNRFARARDGLERLAGSAGHEGPLAFASFTFDESDDGSVMVVPRIAMVRRDGVTRRMTVCSTAGTDDSLRVSPTATSAPIEDDWASERPRYAGSTVRDDLWLEAVARALDEIDAGEYAKVVLARDLQLWSRQPFDVDRLLKVLSRRFPDCMTFLVDHLLGASPELLVSRTATSVASRVLAGTARRGSDSAEDAALGAALLTSAKDRLEHDLALRSAVESLTPFCATLDVPSGPILIHLDNVQHLGSDLVALQPTAAVGGSPRGPAIDAIHRLEGMPRGRYAGPVGWCTPDGDGEFAIALRCADVRSNRARLFAGAGIVAGSLPEAELSETWLKLKAMTGAIDS